MSPDMIPAEWLELLRDLPGWLSMTLAGSWLIWWFRRSRGVSHHETMTDNTGAIRRLRRDLAELDDRVRKLEGER